MLPGKIRWSPCVQNNIPTFLRGHPAGVPYLSFFPTVPLYNAVWADIIRPPLNKIGVPAPILFRVVEDADSYKRTPEEYVGDVKICNLEMIALL